MAKQDTRANNRVDAIKARISGLDAQISKATELVSTLPLEELRAKLTALNRQREEAKAELAQAINALTSAGGAPTALRDLKKLFSELGKTGWTRGAEKNIVDAIHEMDCQLADQSLRRKLLPAVCGLVEKLIVDLRGKRYCVHFYGGSRTDWRKL